MVTHELDIAAYTKRNLVMRDGVIVTDKPVAARTSAKEELRRLDEEHAEVHLSPSVPAS
jgi:putative ABC transport system ATP-binding protein